MKLPPPRNKNRNPSPTPIKVEEPVVEKPPFLEMVGDYLQQYYPFPSLFQRESPAREHVSFNSFRTSRSMQLLIQLLRFSPWLCGLGFALAYGLKVGSYLGVSAIVTAFYQQYQGLVQALYMISVSGLIGFGTNFLAIRMLFRPVIKRPIWGQGLIPAQRERIIQSLAKGMHKHVLSQDLIRRRVEDTGLVTRVNDLLMDGSTGLMQDAALREDLKAAIHDTLVDFSRREDIRQEVRALIDRRLERQLSSGVASLVIKSFKRIREEDYHELIDRVVSEIPNLARDVMERLEQELDRLARFIHEQKPQTEAQIMDIFVDLLNRIDIADLLAKQMDHFDEAKLERMVWEATNEQLLYIQYLGTVLGILGGLLIWRPEVTGVVYVLGFILLYGLDQLIFRWRNRRQT